MVKIEKYVKFLWNTAGQFTSVLNFFNSDDFFQAAAPWQDQEPDQASDPETHFSYLVTYLYNYR